MYQRHNMDLLIYELYENDNILLAPKKIYEESMFKFL